MSEKERDFLKPGGDSEKPLLPVVNPDVGQAIKAEMLKKEGNTYITEILSRIAKENPAVAEFISKIALQSKDRDSVAYVGAPVYRLLESQAEADRLREQFSE